MDVQTKITFKVEENFGSKGDVAQIAMGTVLAESGCALWGPYVELPAGSWKVSFVGEFRPQGDGSYCDVVGDGGTAIFGRSNLTASVGKVAQIDFSLPVGSPMMEFRIFAASGSYLRIDGIELTSTTINASPAALKLPHTEREFKIYRRGGLDLVLDEQSLVDQHIIRQGSWEEDQLAFLKNLIASCPEDSSRKTFLDVGSYFGLYSLHMLRMNFFDDIVAFEADDLNFRQLLANLLINDPLLQITAHNIAAADQDGEEMFLPSWLHPTLNRGGVGLMQSDDNLESLVRVRTTKIDSILSARSNTIFAKLDVEGSELKVLQGMRDTLAANRCVMQVEALLGNEHEERNAAVGRFLHSLGYRFMHSIAADMYFSNFI